MYQGLNLNPSPKNKLKSYKGYYVLTDFISYVEFKDNFRPLLKKLNMVDLGKLGIEIPSGY